MAIILLIQDPQGQMAELPLLQKLVLGRSSSCDFKIEDSKISGKHCTFESTSKGEVVFTDLESTNGSFFNNSQINKTVVRINDVIKIGGTTIKIDERRLNANEKKAIGYSSVKINKNEDKTLPNFGNQKNSDPMTKKSVVLNKSIKQKINSPTTFAASDTVLDQEESSGMTKMLKLEKKSTIKKK
jgi:pSer/pThr/pTyr-binding forkhead associated (FHA) protein